MLLITEQLIHDIEFKISGAKYALQCESDYSFVRGSLEHIDHIVKELSKELDKDFLTFLKRQNKWSHKTFGEGKKVDSILAHIEKEIGEVKKNPNDLIEWVDIMMLAMDGAYRQGYNPEQVLEGLFKKQEINKKRNWPKNPEPGKPIEHIKETD